MAWQLSGQLVENCSCNMFCPCWFGVQDLMVMDQGWCSGGLGLRVDEGSSNGVDLSGRRVAIAVHFPGPTMFDGGAKARAYIDAGASEEQRAELEAICQGQRGGPMEMLGSLVSTWLPPQTASIDFHQQGETITVGVGDTGELGSTPVRDPEGNGFTMRGGGFIGGFGLQEAEIASPNGGRWADSDMPQAVEMKSGARGAFAWAG